jgi:hypothetical protein
MAALSFFTRNQRSGVLFSQNDHGVHLARLARMDERPLEVDLLAELPASADDSLIADWLKTAFPERGPGYLTGYAGFHPIERVLQREMINTRRLAEPGFLATLLAESAKIPPLKDWHVTALHPTDGEEITAATPTRPGLLLGLPLAGALDLQTRLRRLNIRPRRLEVGSVPLLGGLTRHLRDTGYPHAVAVCEIGLGQTRVYFLAKDGVYTPATLPHGLLSIMEAAMKELNAPGIGVARDALFAPTDELRAHSRRLVRMLTRHLRPAIDYFEMQTGQPINALYCASLPSPLGWLEEALCTAVDLEFLVPDLAAWLPAVGLKLADEVVAPGRSWFQPLSLIAQLAPAATASSAVSSSAHAPRT